MKTQEMYNKMFKLVDTLDEMLDQAKEELDCAPSENKERAAGRYSAFAQAYLEAVITLKEMHEIAKNNN